MFSFKTKKNTKNAQSGNRSFVGSNLLSYVPSTNIDEAVFKIEELSQTVEKEAKKFLKAVPDADIDNLGFYSNYIEATMRSDIMTLGKMKASLDLNTELFILEVKEIDAFLCAQTVAYLDSIQKGECKNDKN